MSEPTPWARLLAQSQTIAPVEHVWRLSLREWRALTAPPTPVILDRATFDALAARFPDERST